VAEAVAEALRDAANRGPSRVHANFHRTHAKRPSDTRHDWFGYVEDVRVQRKLAV
jgi:hypothetical protein